MRRTFWTIVLAAALGVACKTDRKQVERKGHEVAEKVERQPVAGRGPYQLYVIDADGKEWVVGDQGLVKDVQARLDAKGFDLERDGKADLETVTALRKFQQARDLKQSGKIDRATARALGIDWARLLKETAKRRAH